MADGMHEFKKHGAVSQITDKCIRCDKSVGYIINDTVGMHKYIRQYLNKNHYTYPQLNMSHPCISDNEFDIKEIIE